MTTVLRRAFTAHFNEYAAKETKFIPFVAEAYRQIIGDEYPPVYIDCAFQKWAGNAIDMFDAWGFARFHAEIMLGHVAVTAIFVGQRPSSDSNYVCMNEKLSLLPPPFAGEFWGGNSDGDGLISWDRPIRAIVTVKLEARRGWAIVPPGSLPLEAGTTEIEKTLMYLYQGIGVARWPYGSQYIYLFSPKHIGKDSADFDKLRRQLKGKIQDEINPFAVMEQGWRNSLHAEQMTLFSALEAANV